MSSLDIINISPTVIEVNSGETLLISNTVFEVITTLEQGIAGPRGANGIDGIQGVNGIDGVQGAKGIDGIQGPNGQATIIGTRDIQIVNLQAGDVLSFDSTNWINRKQELLSDGGNF